ncbi:hypothetical protein BHU72_14750 [Desulfuribacillus stibiiarsenatis]|uniref:Uncharacterized protein n=1 Tax=Desulfuribacillus stibiiarsenatis TaxID=1390249 RepID=A0A1E5L7Q3_9FIRM|nr:hypothetical protein [Desulfuribacillus stibiiarsenatis]OEH86009.1 hypothetical protein BHU72_14750 [Desulfuribacillus stibiiarsenatis]
MITYILPTMAGISVAYVLYSRWKETNELRKRCGADFSKQEGNQLKVANALNVVLKEVRREASYATEYNYAYPITITSTLILMLIGAIAGRMFQSVFLSVTLMTILGLIPWVVLRMMSNQKLMRLELEMPTFITDLIHHLTVTKDMKLALRKMDILEVIKKEQELMRSELSNDIPPDRVLMKLYETTRSRWFLLLSQMADVFEKRSNLDKAIEQLMGLQISIQKANVRLQKSYERMKKKAWMLLLIEAVFVLTIYLAVMIIDDPILYFTQTERGRSQLAIGIASALVPIVYLLYIFLRRR